MPTPHQGGSPMRGPRAEPEIRDRLQGLMERIARERQRGITTPLKFLHPGNEIASLEGSLNHVKRLLELHEQVLSLLVCALPDRDTTGSDGA